MKHIFTILFVFSLHCMVAQSPRYSVTPNPVYTYFVSDGMDHVGHGKLKNLTNDSIFLNWTREIVEKPAGWSTLVCDCHLCYADFIGRSPKINGMGPYDTCNLDVHMIDDLSDGVAHVVLWLYEGQDTSIKYRADYYFNKTVSNNEVRKIEISVFPNPASDYFIVDFNQGLGYIELYSILGKKEISFKAVPKAEYNISRLSDGIYFMKLIGMDNQLIRTIRLVKKSKKA